MPKRNLKKEKAERNEEYAKKFRKDKDAQKSVSFRNWCRMEGHPPNCSCTLPSRDEVITASRRSR